MMISCDVNSEQAVLAGLMKYGSYAFNEISGLDLSDASFTQDSHRVIYRCLDKIFKEHDDIKPDVPLIYSAAVDLGVKYFFQKDEEVQYLGSLFDFPVEENNVTAFAKRIRKLQIVRNVLDRLANVDNKLRTFTGDESIHDIFGTIEESIIDCASFLSAEDMPVSLLSDGMEEHFQEIEENPIEQVGISTSFSIYDEAIGGGLRKGSVNIIAARPKVGKSTLAVNIAKHIASLGIPVLYLDTEMSKIDSWTRMIAAISQVENKIVETGAYTKFTSDKERVHKAIQTIKKLPFFYTSIAGQSLETQISIIKRWIITNVGLQPDGLAKPCVIIYDYLKIMDEAEIKNVAEHQAVGFLVQSLINFAKKYMIPVLSFVQMNRDGINREDTGTISLSDRILWFCSSLAIFKAKTNDEIDKDGPENGNRKLKVLDCRYGPGMEQMDYVNCNFNKSISKISEGKTHYELLKEHKKQENKEKIEMDGEQHNDEDVDPEQNKFEF